MKKVCVLIMGLLCVAAPIFSQDSLVCIKPSTARYFLEIHDEVFILREKDSICHELIKSYDQTLVLKDSIIGTYKDDSVTYQTREATFSSHLRLIREAHANETKTLTRVRNIGVGIGAGAMIGSIIPGVGTLAGGAIGGGIGWVYSVLKRN